MSIYIRKSINVGPIRFNLSNSGIGLSTGIKGFRVGTGPRGNYVHMGRGGLYYRATLPSVSSNPQPFNNPPSSPIGSIGKKTHTEMVAIESCDISQLQDSSSMELLGEINAKQQLTIYWPIAPIFTLFSWFVALGFELNALTFVATAIIGGFLTWYLYQRDELRKTTVIFYEFDQEMEQAYSEFYKATSRLASCSRTWSITAQAKVLDGRYHAGAGKLINRNIAKVGVELPPFLKTNIEIFSINLAGQLLFFFPDKLLIYVDNIIGAVNYTDLQIQDSINRFIESSDVPSDAKIVDYTWSFVNKDGSPDRRFNNNKKIPICLYEEIQFSTKHGVNGILQLSKPETSAIFKSAIDLLAKQIPVDKSQKLHP
jgi:hypothetical protein